MAALRCDPPSLESLLPVRRPMSLSSPAAPFPRFLFKTIPSACLVVCCLSLVPLIGIVSSDLPTHSHSLVRSFIPSFILSVSRLSAKFDHQTHSHSFWSACSVDTESSPPTNTSG